jgi:hypothetical protein
MVVVMKAVMIMKALAMKALVKPTAAKCLVKVFAAAKTAAVKAATTVKDPSTAMEAAAVPGIGR